MRIHKMARKKLKKILQCVEWFANYKFSDWIDKNDERTSDFCIFHEILLLCIGKFALTKGKNDRGWY